MPVKKTAAKSSSPRRLKATEKKTPVREAVMIEEVVTQSIPQKIFNKQRNYVPVLVTALLLVTFLLGMSFMKIQYLEKNQGATANVAANTGQQNPQPSGPPPIVNVDNGHFPVQGDKNAKVTIVEFADLRCPFCKQLYNDTIAQLRKDYIGTGKVQLYWRSYAFLGPASTVASNGAECANEQGKFWEFHDYMYQNQPDESDTSMYTTDKLTEIAGNLGMNTDQFRSCLDGKKYDKNVSDDLAAGQKAGVSGTPTLFIDGQTVVGAQPYSAIKTIIDQELAKK